ncbi:hypothetical protein G6F23_014730 [Rhizopus arrhizus]|nr:hypothetical protein G6F23_014730 [Rhizopus arrhizus]
MRIVDRVVHDEAAVHGIAPAILLHRMGMGMAAQIVVGLEQRDLGFAVQPPGAGQARNTGADDRDAHVSTSPWPAPTRESA